MTTDWPSLYGRLWNLWFGTYSRCGTTLGSSGKSGSSSPEFGVVHKKIFDVVLRRSRLQSDFHFCLNFSKNFETIVQFRLEAIKFLGFEHVFLGEWKSTTVDGHHNWVRYYRNQKAGLIRYIGYYIYHGVCFGLFK